MIMQRLSYDRSVRAAICACFALVVTAADASAQEYTVAQSDGGAPRFLVASSRGEAPVPVDAGSIPALGRRINLDLSDVTIDEALRAIATASRLQLVYSAHVVPVTRRVSVKATDLTVAAALTEVLFRANVDVLLSGGRIVMVPGPKPLQVGVISGRATDSTNREGIGGVAITVEGTRLSATTAADGGYTILGVPVGSRSVTARRLGFVRQSRAVTVADNESATVDFMLVQAPTTLSEVVTTATGDQRRVELGHVVGRINADSLVKEAPVSSLSELLTARVPGLHVFQSQGTVGGEVKVQIRGPNSLLLPTGPIVIVDGIRYTTGAALLPPEIRSNTGPYKVEPTSPLNDINLRDIELIEVVKGPSAATLYGTDASNGVIVITTKRGRPGPARWDVYGKYTSNMMPSYKYPDLYWAWGTVLGVPNHPTFSCSLLVISFGLCAQQDSVTALPNALNDPEFSIFRAAPTWNYGVSVGGGRQDVRYYFSGDFEDATGPVQMPPAVVEQLTQQRGVGQLPDEQLRPNASTKVNLRGNVTAAFGETAELRVNTGYVHAAIRTLGLDARSAYSGAFIRTPSDPHRKGPSDPANSFSQTSTERSDRFFGSASGHWRPAPWLLARATVGLDLTSRYRYSLARRGAVPNDFFSVNGSVGDDRTRQLASSAELGLTATTQRGRLSFRTSLGGQYVRNLSDMLISHGSDLPPGGTSIGEAATIQTLQNYRETVTLGSYIEETVGLNDRLFLTGALRIDGASAFGRDYDATAYPKVGASWLVSQEPFFPDLPGLNELRLRYALGASGQQPLPEWSRPAYAAGQAARNGTVTTAVRLTALGNPDLRPERVREHEFGVDVAAVRNRLQLGLTWFRRRTTDQITTMQLPPGLGVIFTNLGLTGQHGFEANLMAKLVDTRALSWDLSVQDAVSRTKLIDLGGGITSYSIHGGWVEGYSLGARFNPQIAGYADANGDGIIADSEVQLGDPVYAGESIPPRSQTLTTVIGVFERRLRFSALLERRSGFTQLDRLENGLCATTSQCRALTDRSTPLAEQAEAMALWFSRSYSIVQRGDFTRLREVAVTLDVPANISRAFGARSVALSLAGRNLALWTDFSGPDPESAAVNSDAFATTEGIPQGSSWSLRVDFRF
jgi:TonB-linked SusC/RagA family outer membrane protein